MNQFLTDLGFSSVSNDEEARLMNLAAVTVFNRTIVKIADRLTEEDRSELFFILNNPEAELGQLIDFLQARGVEFRLVLDEETTAYQREITAAKDWLVGNA